MSVGAQDRHGLNSFPQLSKLYATYGVRVNALSVDEIFALYERAGFLYPEKAARLKPHLWQVRENWRRMLRGGNSRGPISQPPCRRRPVQQRTRP